MTRARPTVRASLERLRDNPLFSHLERLTTVVRQRDWLLQAMRYHAERARDGLGVARRAAMGRREFFERYYALGRPVILTGALTRWPAVRKWTPEYLARRLGRRVVEFQVDWSKTAGAGRGRAAHARRLPFSAFIELLTQAPDRERYYMTNLNSRHNRRALQPLYRDLRPLPRYLDPGSPDRDGLWWLGPAGTFTPLHYDLNDNFFAQVVGRKALTLFPPHDTGLLYNTAGFGSAIGDADGASLREFPLLRRAHRVDLVLHPGEILFLPVAWWHQARALDFSVSIRFTNLWEKTDFTEELLRAHGAPARRRPGRRQGRS